MTLWINNCLFSESLAKALRPQREIGSCLILRCRCPAMLTCCRPQVVLSSFHFKQLFCQLIFVDVHLVEHLHLHNLLLLAVVSAHAPVATAWHAGLAHLLMPGHQYPCVAAVLPMHHSDAHAASLALLLLRLAASSKLIVVAELNCAAWPPGQPWLPRPNDPGCLIAQCSSCPSPEQQLLSNC